MSVTVQMLVDKVKLDVIYGTQELLQKEIATADISRPGLEMTGYFDCPLTYTIVGNERMVLFNTNDFS